jgi:hypothetical protein
MNQNLIAPVSIEEVQLALNQMAPLKAPGPDGFPAFFIPTKLGMFCTKSYVMQLNFSLTLVTWIPM